MPRPPPARGHHIAKGDLIISRHNDQAIRVLEAADVDIHADPVRNGQRWRVLAVDPEHNCIAARRLDDGARTVFSGDYLRQHVTHGYAVTAHSAQGVTAQTTHAVLGEHTTRSLLYLAMTRGRDTNHAYLYERIAGETEHEHADEPDVHVARRGTSAQAAQLVRTINANRDERARTAHDIAAETDDRGQQPERVHSFLARRAGDLAQRQATYWHWCEEIHDAVLERHQRIEQHREHSRNNDID